MQVVVTEVKRKTATLNLGAFSDPSFAYLQVAVIDQEFYDTKYPLTAALEESFHHRRPEDYSN